MTQILEIVYQEFKTSNQHTLAKAVRNFRSAFDLKTCTPRQAIEFQKLMTDNLNSSDAEAAYWLETIAALVQEVMNYYNPNNTEPYLIARLGREEVKRWDKRRWNDAEPVIRKTVEGYLKAGWDLHGFNSWNVHGAEVQLEKHDTLMNSDGKGWHHFKTLMIDKRGNIVCTRNAKSFMTTGETYAKQT